ncbi:MAG: IS1 family transposase [Endozoicomonas sp. (ex Botrylloides leachii)]|nr:IS1 family transposase [Endozoicomonas sp. (ex Botrylloides leachii)]
MIQKAHKATYLFLFQFAQWCIAIRQGRIKRLVRLTICFSKSEEIHDKVIGELISRELSQLYCCITNCL